MSVPLAYIGVILIWSTTPLGIKWSGEDVGFIFGVTARMLLGAFVCLVFLALLSRRMKWNRKALHTYLAAGIGVWSTMSLVYWAAQHVSSGLISVIFGLMPLITGVMAAIWLNERVFTLPRIAGMTLGLVGLMAVFYEHLDADSHAVIAMVAILSAVTCQSISAVWVKRIGSKMHPLEVTTGALLIALPLFGLLYIASGHSLPVAISERTAWSIAYLGVFGSALGFILYFYVLKWVEAGKVALIALVTPVMALMLGQWINHEVVAPSEWFGTLLILFGLASYQWGERWTHRAA